MHYRFLGRLIAKSMIDDEMNLEVSLLIFKILIKLKANFTKSFLKHMTN